MRYPPASSKRFEKITSMHIEKVMDGIRENTTAFGIRKPISWRRCSIPFPPSTTTMPCWSITILPLAPKGRHFSCPILGGTDTVKRPHTLSPLVGKDEVENAEIPPVLQGSHDAGFSPICPTLFLPLFCTMRFRRSTPNGIDMAPGHLLRSCAGGLRQHRG